MEEQVLLQIKNVSKRYGGLQALDEVSLDVRQGEVHAVVGENGAGKSTLMKILGGAVQRNSGVTIFKQEEVEFLKPMESIKAGIAVIHQELSMLPTLNVIENIFMGRMPSKFGKVNWEELESRTLQLLDRVGLKVDPYVILDALTISQRQMVEIAKALSVEASLIIMDEPNSSLCETETEILFEVIYKLKKEGISIIYVSHKIDEVLRISDRISVLKDGKYMGTVDKKDATSDSIIKMMVGRELKRFHIDSPSVGAECLRVKNLSNGWFKNVSFDLHYGEVLGFAGLVGSGRSEVLRAIFGADRYESGEIIIDGKPVSFSSPTDAIRWDMAMVPEDRKKLSLFIDLPIEFNIMISSLNKCAKGGIIDYGKVAELVKKYKTRLNIKMGSPDDPVKSLSGGNQQKTVLARWLATEPKILILDEPTHGVDVGAKAEIYALIRDLAKKGMAIILISSELPEIIAMTDRAVVMHEGCVTGILERDQMSEEKIMACATGCLAEDL